MAMRKKAEALSLGLGDAAEVAKDITNGKKEIAREFRSSPMKGVVKQSTIQKRIAKRQAREQREYDRAYNPKVKGLAGIEGIAVDENGEIGLEELRRQRPDIFEMKPLPVEGAGPSWMDKINELRRAEGRADPKYDRLKPRK